MEHPRRSPGLVGPLVLISLGVLLLLNNMGLVNWSIWLTLLRLWPLLLILGGLDLLIGRRSFVGSLIVAVLFLAVLGAAVWISAAPGVLPGQNAPVQQITAPGQGATSANVELSHGVTNFVLSAGSEATALITGQVAVPSGETLQPQTSSAGGVLTYSLKTNGVQTAIFTGSANAVTWDLKLNPSIPIALDLNNGVGESNVDLSSINLTNANFSTGVGKMAVTVPSRGKSTIKASLAIGELRITVPPGVAARIHASSALGTSNISTAFQRQGDYYQSPNYGSADNQVELDLSTAIGTVTVQ